MLSKLLKYEVRATARALLPLYAGLVLAWGVERGYALLCSGMHLKSTIPDIVQFLLALVYWLTLLAAGLMTVFVNVRQFYRLLGEDGYFLFPLPASAAQHIAAKLLCGVGWMGVFFLLGVLLNGGQPFSTLTATDGATYYFAGNPLSWGAERLLNVGLAGLCVLAFVCEYLLIYLCIIVGGHWPRRRALASLLTYFGANAAWQTALILGMVALLNNDSAATAIVDWFERMVDRAQRVDAIVPMLWSMVGIAAVGLAAVGGVLWAIDRYFVGKRLNIA